MEYPCSGIKISFLKKKKNLKWNKIKRRVYYIFKKKKTEKKLSFQNFGSWVWALLLCICIFWGQPALHICAVESSVCKW